eukprot:CAMPEP_0203674202 /NCGR_PEP_ID=MMETSP0090-20130426/15255_1 /ASSEMBLY_ACC=CAM_ASM_001088 /TAXON_ID=426623 /ORGANISM="Chaetoceros affinis, Strain CCMP159" /LENGTH=840 /DNA_ID=CAMNT_0050540011 /DNA_START=163 /DNA_END=2682 /DNA_ORIENTATION=-
MSSVPEQNGGPPAPIFNMIHRFFRESFEEVSISSSGHNEEEEAQDNAEKNDSSTIDNDGEEMETGTTEDVVQNLPQPDLHQKTGSPTNKYYEALRPSSAASPKPMRNMKDHANSVSHTAISNLKRHSSVQAKISSHSTRSHSYPLSNSSHHHHHHHHHHRDPPARERPKDDKWPERDSLSFTRSLVFYGTGSITEEHERACKYIMEVRSMRKKYFGSRGTRKNTVTSDEFDRICREETLEFDFNDDGVIRLFRSKERKSAACADCRRTGNEEQQQRHEIEHEGVGLITVPNIDEFVNDYRQMEFICADGAMRSFCFQRLQMLHSAFKMHVTANGTVENEAQSNLLGTDFYRTMKIDNHIHLAAAASAKQFVNFVGEKLESEGDTIVMEDGSTLKEVFESAGLSADHMTIDAFNVLADYSVYQRFDNFNSKYSPFRLGEVRKIFLKVANIIEGRYFAELTKSVLARLEQSKGHNSAAEMRLSIYGMERGEWLNLAKWVLRDWGGPFPGPVLSTHNRWIVQVPRLWRIYSMKRKNCSFQDMLENLFCPIFEATLYPENHPEIAELLNHIVAFDSVDDEGALEAPLTLTRPSAWKKGQNPAYCWQLYYLWANIEILNSIRKAKGLNTFAFRPHAGETGDVMHLAATYMLSTSINHGINLEHQVSLQYLYYLDQVGLSLSPLSNNFLFKKIRENPFPKLFKRGLNVTLSTDDPLLFHMSDDALLEEYAVARASFDLSMTDVSEIARNSILQSGFEDEFKKKWLGDEYKRGITFCNEVKTHVPLIRAKFRAEHLAIEHMLVNLIASGKGEAVLREMMVHFGHARNAHRNILFDNLPDVSPFPEQN